MVYIEKCEPSTYIIFLYYDIMKKGVVKNTN